MDRSVRLRVPPGLYVISGFDRAARVRVYAGTIVHPLFGRARNRSGLLFEGSVEERSREIRRVTRFRAQKSGNVSGWSARRREVPRHARDFCGGRNPRRLYVRNDPLFPVGSRRHEVRSGSHKGGCVVRSLRGIRTESGRPRYQAERPARKSRSRNLEFFRVELQFFEVGFPRGVVGVEGGEAYVSSGERDPGSVDVRESSGKRVVGIVDHVVPGRIVRHRGFGRNRGLQRPRVRFSRRFARVFRITGQRQEADGRQYCQNGDDDDQFYEGEA